MKTLGLLCWILMCAGLTAQTPRLRVEQVTRGPYHHFFGYIGQSLTTPWNADGQYMLTLRTTFHDRMPTAQDAADICLVDVHDDYRVIVLTQTRAWNFQQGTMFYWHPRRSQTQFFFNDRDPQTNRIYTVLYDIERRERVREYRFDDVAVANGGVDPRGHFFLAINYARMARLRPVTGYPETVDTTSEERAPANDGIFRVEVDTGKRSLLVSFQQLRRLLQDRHPHMQQVGFYINHSLCSRQGQYVYFFARGRFGDESMAVNVPCSVRTDGTALRAHTFIGGHPEWDDGPVVIGSREGRQVRYNIETRRLVGEIGKRGDFPNPEGDIALGPAGEWFANGYSVQQRKQIRYILMRRSDQLKLVSPLFSRGPYQRGVLRIDPAPRWDRHARQVLVPGITADGTRQLHLLKLEAAGDDENKF